MRKYTRDGHGNGIPNGNGNPMGMGIDDTIGNGNGKEWEPTCMGMGMTLIPMGFPPGKKRSRKA